MLLDAAAQPEPAALTALFAPHSLRALRKASAALLSPEGQQQVGISVCQRVLKLVIGCQRVSGMAVL